MPAPSSRIISSIACFAAQLRADPQIAALRHGIDGVDDHGEHDLLDLCRIAMDGRQLRCDVQVELSCR